MSGSRGQVDEISWYHSLELPGGIRTKGWVDCGPILDRVLLPRDLAGARVLDVGTWDGYWAFELERRGAEVTTVDIDDPKHWDWPPRLSTKAHRATKESVIESTDLGRGFRLAHDLLESKVKQERLSIYDLSNDRLGTYDLVVVGSILLHLQDPVRALDAVRQVSAGQVVINEAIELMPTLLSPSTPRARLEGDDAVRWWQPNLAAVRAMASSAGLEVERWTRPFAIPLGEGHPGPPAARRQLRAMITPEGREHLIAWNWGIPHTSMLCRASPRA